MNIKTSTNKSLAVTMELTNAPNIRHVTNILAQASALFHGDDDSYEFHPFLMSDDEVLLGESEEKGTNDGGDPLPRDTDSSSSPHTATISSSDRCVRFTAAHETSSIISLDNYTDEEKRRCWYTQEEKSEIAVGRKKALKSIELNKPETTSKMTYRGLEACTDQGSRKLEYQVLSCVQAVLDEQDRQRLMYTGSNCDGIAAASRRISAWSQTEAEIRALEDMREAHQVVSTMGEDPASSTHHCCADTGAMSSSGDGDEDLGMASSSDEAEDESAYSAVARRLSTTWREDMQLQRRWRRGLYEATPNRRRLRRESCCRI